MPGTSQTGGDICERRRAEIAGRVVSGTLSIQEACAQHQLSPELLLEWVAAFRQASLTAFDEQVRRTLADQGVDVSTLASAEFQGDLGEFTIADLIQTLTLGERDGTITVSHEARESRLWCAGGEIIDAESGRLTGIAAVHRMLTLEHGRVRASFHRVRRARRVHVSTMELLLDGARRGDECRVLRSRLGAQPYRTASLVELDEASSSSAEAALLCQFRSARSIAAALAESDSGDLETLTDIARLVEQGRLVPSSDESRSSPAPAVSNPPLVLSFARFPTKPATPRAHRRWVVAAGLLALGLLTLPRYLLASRSRQPEPPALSTAASQVQGRTEHALGQAALSGTSASASPAAPGADRWHTGVDGRALQPQAAALQEPTSESEAARIAADGKQPPSPRTAPRTRRRSARGGTTSTDAAAPATAGESRSAASPTDDARGASAPPRMQLIEARRPQMQILE